jgi:acyl carrier protein
MPDSTTTESTFGAVADIIAETSSIERDKITMQSHTINDLGIDSLDFLDITFAIDKRFGIKMPVEQWMEDVNEGRASADEFFVMSNLVAKIDELIAAKA